MNNQNKLFQHAKFAGLEFNTRRHFLKECRTGIGMMALGSILDSCNLFSDKSDASSLSNPLNPKTPHFQGKAKSVIFLHMAGAPSQLELFDYKPELQKWMDLIVLIHLFKERNLLLSEAFQNYLVHKPSLSNMDKVEFGYQTTCPILPKS